MRTQPNGGDSALLVRHESRVTDQLSVTVAFSCATGYASADFEVNVNVQTLAEPVAHDRKSRP
jgi:hypothetical protein